MTAEQYLQEHGISESFALEYGVAWDDNYLHIPVKDAEGNLLFLKSRNLHHGEEGNTAPKYKNPTGSVATLFNFHAVKDSPNIVLCEGEIDCLKLISEGIPSVSSTGGSNTFKEEWVELLKGKNLFICYDNDPAGKAGVRHLLPLFPSAIVVQLPDTIKDISDYFVAGHTKKEFLKLPQYSAEDWNIINRPPDFNLLSAKKYSEREITQQPWLIEGVIYSQGFCFIYGAEGTGKSYLALSIADAIASGKPWLDKFPTTQGNVLFLDKENPHGLIKKRLDGLKMTQENIYWLEYPEKFQLTDFQGNASEFALALSEIVQEKQIDLIIIDSFVDLVVGSENSSADTQAFFNAIRELFPQIAYLPLHHENKPSQGVSRSDSQRLRGSTNINAQTFTMFRLEPVAKSKTELTLKQTKARDTVRLDKFMVRMQVVDLPDGTTTVSGFEYMGEVEEGVDDSKSSEIQEAIKGIIADKGMISRKEVVSLGEKMGASKSTTLRAIDSLLAGDEVSKSRQGREIIYIPNMFSENDVLDELNEEII